MDRKYRKLRRMSRRRPPESFYYKPIQKFLKNRMGCVVASYSNHGEPLDFISRGLGGLIVDVYGVRGVKERGSRALEGLAVEVKRTTSHTSLGHIAQAGQYARLAHRCYLAQPRKFSREDKAEASRSGIGLLQMSKSGRGIKLIVESRDFSPDPETFYMFLHKSLRVVRCGLCSCFLFRYRAGERGVAVKGHFVRDDLSGRKGDGKNKKMYICQECEDMVAGIAETKKLQKTVRGLESRVASLHEQIRRFGN